MCLLHCEDCRFKSLYQKPTRSLCSYPRRLLRLIGVVALASCVDKQNQGLLKPPVRTTEYFLDARFQGCVCAACASRDFRLNITASLRCVAVMCAKERIKAWKACTRFLTLYMGTPAARTLSLTFRCSSLFDSSRAAVASAKYAIVSSHAFTSVFAHAFVPEKHRIETS